MIEKSPKVCVFSAKGGRSYEEKILIPSAHLAQHGEGVNQKKQFKNIYGWGEVAPLTGLMYCADCGGKMYVHRINELKEHINENGINYTLCGDYYIPDWQIPVTDRTLGYYGRMRKAYLKTQRPVLYAGYVAHGTLFEHCTEIETQARHCADEVILNELIYC